MKIQINENLRGYPLAVEVMAHIEWAEEEANRTGDVPAARSMPGWNQGTWGEMSTDPTPEAKAALEVYLKDNDYEPYDLPVSQVASLPEDAPACGTAFCHAGWANVLTGQKIKWQGNYHPHLNRIDWVTAELADGTPISESAVNLLEIAPPEGADPFEGRTWELFRGNSSPELFNGSNTLDDLYQLTAAHYDLPEGTLRNDVEARLAGLKAMA